jgi:hypothetical protein
MFLQIKGCFYERYKLIQQVFGVRGPDLKLSRATIGPRALFYACLPYDKMVLTTLCLVWMS